MDNDFFDSHLDSPSSNAGGKRGYTGVLQQGELHPDLVNRLAMEASKVAGHVLNMCIRALDYCPPVDLTFGEYLRALITADMDLVRGDPHSYRVAFIESFRRRGIYPDGIRTLAEDSLRWSPPGFDQTIEPGQMDKKVADFVSQMNLRKQIDRLRYLKNRDEIWKETRILRKELHEAIAEYLPKAELIQALTGLALSPIDPPEGVRLNRRGKPKFSINAIREARRQREDGRMLNQVFITILQSECLPSSSNELAKYSFSLLMRKLEVGFRGPTWNSLCQAVRSHYQRLTCYVARYFTKWATIAATTRR